MMTDEQKEVKNKLAVSKTKLIILAAIILVAIATAFVVVFFSGRESGKQAVEIADQKLIEAVGKLISLPDEQPSIATILDKTKLSDQPFFAKAENDDRLLLYTGAGKAILYRPSTNQLIEVMPLVINANEAAGGLPSGGL